MWLRQVCPTPAARGALVVHLRLTDPQQAAGPARAGFVVPKAIGGAVVRNQVKRRLRHLMRERLGRLPDGTDVVVRALPAAARRSSTGLAADLDAALDVATRGKPAAR